MGGEIGLRSEPGSGSTFWVRLRRQANPDTGRMSPDPPAANKILVVDDELSVRESVGYALEQEGFEVTSPPTARRRRDGSRTTASTF